MEDFQLAISLFSVEKQCMTYMPKLAMHEFVLFAWEAATVRMFKRSSTPLLPPPLLHKSIGSPQNKETPVGNANRPIRYFKIYLSF